MATTTIDGRKDDQATPKPHHHRDDYQHLETLDQLGLVHDKDDHLTPIDVLFNAKESAPKPKHEPREVL